MRSDLERLRDILEAIERIERYSVHGKSRFETDELVQVWFVQHLTIIGEACRTMSSDFKQQHRDIPWGAIAGMRNILVHQYFGIDHEAVWSAIEHNIPDLKAAVLGILDDVQTGD